MSDSIFEIADPEIDVDEIMRTIRENIRRHKEAEEVRNQGGTSRDKVAGDGFGDGESPSLFFPSLRVEIQGVSDTSDTFTQGSLSPSRTRLKAWVRPLLVRAVHFYAYWQVQWNGVVARTLGQIFQALESAEGWLQGLERGFRSLEGDFKNLEGNFEGLERGFRSLEGDFKNLEGNSRSSEEAQKELRRQLGLLGVRFRGVEGRQQRLQEQVGQLTEQVHRGQEKSGEHQKHLQEQVERLVEQLHQGQGRQQQLQEEVERLIEQLYQRQEEQQRLREQVEQLYQRQEEQQRLREQVEQLYQRQEEQQRLREQVEQLHQRQEEQQRLREQVEQLYQRQEEQQQLREQVEQLYQRQEEQLRLREQVEQIYAEGHRSGEAAKNLTGEVAVLSQRHTDLVRRYQEVRQENALQKRRLDLILGELRKKAGLDKKSARKIAEEGEHLLDHTYFLFENQFRGTQEEIRRRQEIYLPVFRNYLTPDSLLLRNGGFVLDLGCGRGEMLEVLREAGIPAKGVDLNEDMVHLCREKGLDVIQADLFSYLRALPSGSLVGAISCQVIEHLTVEQNIELLKLLLDKLLWGGRLILETVNPENLLVSSFHFHLDLSHKLKIPAVALAFLAESLGLTVMETRYLSPYPQELRFRLPEGDSMLPFFQPIHENFRRLNDFFFGPQDYALICRKGGE